MPSTSATVSESTGTNEKASKNVEQNMKKRSHPKATKAAPAGVATEEGVQVKLDSPNFILENLDLPEFEKAIKEKAINYEYKIVQIGKEHVSWANEYRDTVRKWCKENNVQETKSTCNHERLGASIVMGIHVSYSEKEVKDS